MAEALTWIALALLAVLGIAICLLIVGEFRSLRRRMDACFDALMAHLESTVAVERGA